MRLSNISEKLRIAALCAFGIAVLSYCAYQVYCAVVDGTVMIVSRPGRDDWITFRSKPGFYVFSLSLYGLVCALGIGVLCAWLLGLFGQPQPRRSPEDMDNAVRLDVDSR